MKRHIIIYSILCLLLTSLMAACHYKDFDECHDDGGDEEVTFVYDYAQLGFTPKMMRLVVYPLDGQMAAPVVRDFTDSLTISLPQGRYRVVAFNDDSGILRFSGYDTVDGNVMITTGHANKDNTALLDTIGSNDYYDYPDRVATTCIDGLTLDVNDKGARRVVLTPTEATSHVHVSIEGLRNLGLLQKAVLSIDSCYVEYYPATGSTGSKAAYIVSPDVNINAADSLLTSTFNVFGIAPMQAHTLRLAVYGSNFQRVLRFNLKDKIEQAEGSKEIYIRLRTDFDIDDLVPHDGSGGGFEVDVNDWKNDSTEIHL